MKIFKIVAPYGSGKSLKDLVQNCVDVGPNCRSVVPMCIAGIFDQPNAILGLLNFEAVVRTHWFFWVCVCLSSWLVDVALCFIVLQPSPPATRSHPSQNSHPASDTLHMLDLHTCSNHRWLAETMIGSMIGGRNDDCVQRQPLVSRKKCTCCLLGLCLLVIVAC